MKVCPECQTSYPEDSDFCPRDGMKLRYERGEHDDPMIGRVLDGRWIVEERIGEGGMGFVYKGSQKSVNRVVAIKTLRAGLADNEEFVDRFFREARIATTINHPHCVTILDFGQTEDESLFLAMEFLEGSPLDGIIDEQRLELTEILRVGIQISSALAAAHDLSIVHRDLKPENIFMLEVAGGETFAKVLDFGIAKIHDGSTQFTRTGQIFGTPEYMSPEQCSGGHLDGRSDLYSMGCILYELVDGHPPFCEGNPMATLMAHVSEPPPPLDADVPRALQELISRLLAKEPDERLPDATALRRELETLLAQIDAGTSPHEVVGTLGLATTGEREAPPPRSDGSDESPAADGGEFAPTMGFEESAPHTPVEARSGDTGPTDTASADAVADTAASVETREPSGPQPEPRPARGATAAIPVSSDSGAGNTAPITEAPEEVFAAPPSYGRSKLLLFGALAAGLLLVGAGSVLGYLYVEKKGPFAESTQAPSRAVASASETSERTESPDTEGSTPERTDDTPQKTAAADTPPASATSGSAEPEDVDERVDTPPPKSSVESKKKVVDDAPVETGSGSTSSDASEKRAKAISKKASSKKATSTKTADRPKTPLADKGDGGDTSPTSKKSDSPESSSPDDEAAKEDEASEPVEKTAEVSTDKTSDDASGDSKKSGYESLMNDAFE